MSHFGRGSSPILHKRIQCTRNDSIFGNCSKTDRDTSQCQHVAGVICEGIYMNTNMYISTYGEPSLPHNFCDDSFSFLQLHAFPMAL